MSLLSIKKAIEDRFIANWTGTNLDSNVRFENTEFTPQSGEEWVSLDIVWANSQNAAIHTNLDTRRNGFIIIDAYAMADQGSRGAIALVDEANSIFENQQFNNIQCLASRPRHIGINNTQGSDATWYIYRTSIPFYSYE